MKWQKFLNSLNQISKIIALKMLVWYKKYLSRNTCRYIPSCSEYTYEAVAKYGVLKGIYLGLKRILRCHPWGGSGVDLLK